MQEVGNIWLFENNKRTSQEVKLRKLEVIE